MAHFYLIWKYSIAYLKHATPEISSCNTSFVQAKYLNCIHFSVFVCMPIDYKANRKTPNRLKTRLTRFLITCSSVVFKERGSRVTPETRKLLAQMYEESIQDTSTSARPLETMRQAYQQICAGEDPWTGLGNFSHAWYGYAKGKRAMLVNEPLIRPAQETEYSRRWAAFCAASVEFLCDRYQISCPDWVHDPYYILENPWWKTNRLNNPAVQEHLLKVTPTPFARRNIFCTNRLFQNKYEMYEWTQEARAKGLTDSHEIWRYARDREIAIHGA